MQAGRRATATGARRVPLVLAAAVGVHVGVAEHDGHRLGAGRPEGDQLARRGRRRCSVASAGGRLRLTTTRGGPPHAGGGGGRARWRASAPRPGSATAPATGSPATTRATWTAQSVRRDLAELAGAVERVDDPHPLGRQSGGVGDALLGQHRVAGAGSPPAPAISSSWACRSPAPPSACRRGRPASARRPSGAADRPAARRPRWRAGRRGRGHREARRVVGHGQLLPPVGIAYQLVGFSLAVHVDHRCSPASHGPDDLRAHPPPGARGRGHPHHPRGGGRVRAARAAVLRRQGLGGDAAPGRQGVRPGPPAVPGDAHRHGPQLPRGPRLPRPPGRRAGRPPGRGQRAGRHRRRAGGRGDRPPGQPQPAADRAAARGHRGEPVRRRVRRRPPRRGEGAGQGAGVQLPRRVRRSGTRRTSAPSCGASTTGATARASTSGSSRSPTGPSSTSGSTSPTEGIDLPTIYFAHTPPGLPARRHVAGRHAVVTVARRRGGRGAHGPLPHGRRRHLHRRGRVAGRRRRPRSSRRPR